MTRWLLSRVWVQPPIPVGSTPCFNDDPISSDRLDAQTAPVELQLNPIISTPHNPPSTDVVREPISQSLSHTPV